MVDQPKPGRRRPRRSRLRRVVTSLVLLVAGGFLVVVAAFAVAYALIDVPDPNANFQADTSFVYYADGGPPLGSFAVQHRVSVPLAEVPGHLQAAVVAAENRTFYTDQGVSPVGILRASWNNVTSGDTEGASTITQQYVKVLYLSQAQTYTRKLKEAIIAIKLEREQSKEQILAGYLNTIYFGRGAYGVEAAAHAYFGTSVQNLSVRESAALAAILNSPGTYDPAGGPDNRRALRGRYSYVLNGMVDTGALEADAAARLAERLPDFEPPDTSNSLGGPKGFLMTMVEAELKAAGLSEELIYGGGLEIETTFERQAMAAAKEAVRRERPRQHARGVHIAIASVRPRTGAVVSMYGGPDYVEDQFNWATAEVPPGSAFKPFALAAGIERGYGLGDVFTGDSPYVFPDGLEVENQGGIDYGPVSLLTATENSINTAYVDLTATMDDGPERVIDAAVRAGIPRDAPGLGPRPTITLGEASISPLDMADAYATFAAGGVQADWYTVEQVSDPSGTVRYEARQRRRTAFGKAVSADVAYAMQQVVRSGTGTVAQALSRPAAAKTGTATDDEGEIISAWFGGYTPQLATTVMYTRGNGRQSLNGVGGLPVFFGGEYPGRTWTTYMRLALAGEPVLRFPPPRFLNGRPTATVTVDPTTDPSPSAVQTTTVTPTQTAEPTTSSPTVEPSPSPSPPPTSQTPTLESPTPTAPSPTPPNPTPSVHPTTPSPVAASRPRP